MDAESYWSPGPGEGGDRFCRMPAPLPAGKHLIRFRAHFPAVSFEPDITHNITLAPRKPL